MIVSELGLRLAAVRKSEGLSQEQMSERLKVSRSTYQYYERGERDVPAFVLQNAYINFDIDPLWLLMGESEDGIDRRTKEIVKAYRKILLAIYSRVEALELNISIEKKCDAAEFILTEILETRTDEPEIGTTKIDSVLRLIR